jgi:hypothetical protein
MPGSWIEHPGSWLAQPPQMQQPSEQADPNGACYDNFVINNWWCREELLLLNCAAWSPWKA